MPQQWFSYRLTRFDLAVTPVLCHGAHGYGQGGPVLSPPISLLGQVQLQRLWLQG